jgi:TonB family protein
MGYTALLFCPDEKTARTVTQVLSELEFAVEACAEPFAAVKKLMGQHFDAVVVDCDNEQNATLLFKSARNSASNQTSLAVAVVEGQAGVAKAFRIGANLVLTKPINIDQAKGTLRVARGLLRKSEPAKAGAVPLAATSKPAVSKPVSELAKVEPVRPIPAAPEIPVAKTAPPAWPTAAAASARASAQDDDLLGIDHEVSAALRAITNQPASSSDSAPVLASELPAAPPAASKSGLPASSGAASAPAPAREVSAPPVPEKPAENDSEDDILVVDSQPQPESPSIVGSAPTFTFGAAEAPAESSGGSKKIFIGIAAVVIVAIGLYAGWAHFHESADQPANHDTSSAVAPAATPQPAKAVSQPPAMKTSASTAPSTQASGAPTPKKLQDEIEAAAKGDSSATGKSGKLTSSDTTNAKQSDQADELEAAPLVVKGGKVPAARAKSGSDAPAPSLSAMAAPSAATPPPTFISSTGTAIKPTLQTLSVSQGVSRGLLVKKIAPAYPPSALRLGVEGTVELLATISKNGDISQIKVLSGDSQLTKAATDAVKQWKYRPYLLNGEPVEIQTQVSIIFKLPR